MWLAVTYTLPTITAVLLIPVKSFKELVQEDYGQKYENFFPKIKRFLQTCHFYQTFSDTGKVVA
jgi:hypothetical protein